MSEVVQSFKLPDSGLEIKTRNWLKITIPDAFIGKYLYFVLLLYLRFLLFLFGGILIMFFLHC